MYIKSAEQLYREDIEKIKEMTFMDDILMRTAFRNDLPFAQFVIRIIMQKPDLILTEVRTQYDMKRLRGRSITLDILGEDPDGTKYNIEIQNANEGASPKRARYHSSAIDVEFLNIKDDFDKLPETYVIFLTENDVFGENKTLYPVERVNLATGKMFDDKEHILYVNCAYSKADSDIARLVHDFCCKDPERMYYKEMSEKLKDCKHLQGGAVSMRNFSEEIRQDTREQEALKVALKMLKLGKNSLSDIIEISELSAEDIKSLAADYKVPLPN